MSYQFIHVETYSRSGGRNERYTVRDIMAEARRSPEASLHVAAPLPPVLVAGCALEELEQKHDSVITAARETLANGKERAVRKDTCSLYTAVLSHPATPEECRADSATMAAVKAWARDSAAWLQRDVEARGGTLETVIMHVDESHIHLHAYGLHPSGYADRLHPGKVAKRDAVAAAIDRGHEKKTANAFGDKAYVEALRNWQDSYSREVGLPHGLTRLGPARRRLTRAEWKAEQAAARSVKQARGLAEAATGVAKAAEGVRDQILKDTHEKTFLAFLEVNRRIEAASRTEKVAKQSAKSAKKLILNAHRERERIISRARIDLRRLRSFGSILRTLWDSVRVSAIRRKVEEELRGLIDREATKAADARRRLEEETRRRMAAEKRLADAMRSAHDLGRQRDEIRRERDRLRQPVIDALPLKAPKFR